MFDQIITLAQENLLLTGFIAVILLLILFRLFRSMRMYLGAKNYVKKAQKLDKKRYNGLTLVEKTARRRRKNTNSFKKLRNRSKKWVRKYFAHKADELPVVTRYKNGKLFKRSRSKLLLLVRNEKKTIKKIPMKKAEKMLFDLTNKYECLDEVITFLHHLPNAILNEEDYDIYFGEDGLILTYQIK